MFAWSSKYGELWPGYQAKDGSKSRLQTLTILLPSLGGCKEWQPGKMQLSKSWFFFFPLGLWIAQAAVWSILWEKDRWDNFSWAYEQPGTKLLLLLQCFSHLLTDGEGKNLDLISSVAHVGPPVTGTELFWLDVARSAENWELSQILITKVRTFLMADIFG